MSTKSKTLRRHWAEWIVVATPMIIYGIAYRMLRFIPRFMPIDTAELYHTEVQIFGMNGHTLCEYCAVHNAAWADLLAGAFYICWVPLPILFAFWLYFTRRSQCLYFTTAFMLMNMIGFVCYYIHPAAPPWYVMQHGFTAMPDTPGCAAGLLRCDAILHYPLFENMYHGTTNVFAALPSLHSAKVPCALLFALLLYKKEHARGPLLWVIILSCISVGTWLAAVYTAHHYVIDVLCGIILVPTSYLLFRALILPSRWFKRLERYVGN